MFHQETNSFKKFHCASMAILWKENIMDFQQNRFKLCMLETRFCSKTFQSSASALNPKHFGTLKDSPAPLFQLPAKIILFGKSTLIMSISVIRILHLSSSGQIFSNAMKKAKSRLLLLQKSALHTGPKVTRNIFMKIWWL